jgi:Tat protein secretion system quality control protein TatD with DNase activity
MNVVNKMGILDFVDRQKLLLETDAPHQFNDRALTSNYSLK